MAKEKMGQKQLNGGRIAHSLNRSDARRNVHAHLCEVYPKGETQPQISEATGYDKEIVLGALLGDTDKYKTVDALVTIGLATMREEEVYGQKIMVFTAISNGKDINDVLMDYARNNSPLAKIKKYLKQLEKILEERRKKKQP